MSRITIHDLNDKQKAMIDPKHRAGLGKAAITSSEAQRRYARQEEKRMHEKFEEWLKLHQDELYWDHSRMDQKTTNRKGHPDFVIQSGGRTLNIEFKVPGNVLSEDQEAVHEWLFKVGSIPRVCFDVATAIEVTRMTLLRKIDSELDGPGTDL